MENCKQIILILLITFTSYANEPNCEYRESQRCIDSICKHASTTDCHQQCRSHATAKCSSQEFNIKSDQKAKKFDIYMDSAQKLNQCLERCRTSSDRNCSHACRDQARKSVK